MSRLLRFLLMLAVAMCVAIAATGDRAMACELCRSLGTSAYHIPGLVVGGDDPNDALTSLPDGADEDDGAAHPAFVTTGGQWPQPGGPGSPVTLTYSYENMFDGGLKGPDNVPLPASLIRRSIETALGLWASVTSIHFVEVEDDGLSYGQGASKYGQLRFRHVYINGPDIPGQQPIAKAQAYFPFSGDPYAGDVEFDHSDPWQEVGTLPIPDILGAATHEIGHTIGLGHTDIPQANMYWIFRRTKGLNDGWLHPDDIAGIRTVYGAGVGSVTSLPIPEPATAILMLVALLAFAAASRVVLDPGKAAE